MSLTTSTRAAILANVRNAGRQWARDRATPEELREGAFPRDLLADLVTWPCTLGEIIENFREGARAGVGLRKLPDLQAPGQPPQPFRVDW